MVVLGGIEEEPVSIAFRRFARSLQNSPKRHIQQELMSPLPFGVLPAHYLTALGITTTALLVSIAFRRFARSLLVPSIPCCRDCDVSIAFRRFARSLLYADISDVNRE